jgi:hypothetical protein
VQLSSLGGVVAVALFLSNMAGLSGTDPKTLKLLLRKACAVIPAKKLAGADNYKLNTEKLGRRHRVKKELIPPRCEFPAISPGD